MNTQTATGSQGTPRRHPPTYTTRMEQQLDEMLLGAFDDVVDVRLLPSRPAEGRSNPKVFIIVRDARLELYQRITRVTLQLGDLLGDVRLNFDIIPEHALPLVPLEALSVRR